MRQAVAKLFRIEAGERGRVLAFMLLGALLQAGLAAGTSAADSLFLVNVGADRLPVIYVVTPMIMLLYIPAYSWLLGRFGIDRVFDLTLLLLVIGGVGFYFGLSGRDGAEPTAFSYYAVKLYAALWYIGLYTLLWNFIDGYFHLVDAKRLFGLLAGGSAVGAIAGGALVNQLSEHIDVRSFFLMWAGFSVLAWPVVYRIRTRYRPVEAAAGGEAEVRPPLRETLKAIFGSRFVLVLVLVLFLTLLTATICEYQYLHVFSQSADEKTLAALFGQLFALVNAFNLVVTVFLFNQLVLRLGVRNVALIQPITYLIVFGLLLIQHGFGAALLGFIAFQGIMTSIDFNNVNLLFTGLPEQGKKQLRTFIEGICEPLATATTGVFLYFVAPKLSPENLSTIGFICALMCLLLVLVLRVDYVQVMVANVRKGWLDFTAARADTLPAAGEPDLAFLEKQAQNENTGIRLSALRMLWRNAPQRATEPIFGFLARANAAERQAARPLVGAMLASQDRELLQRCVEWSARNAESLDPLLFEEFGRYGLMPVEAGAARLTAPDPADRAAAVALLWQSGRMQESRAALQTVDKLLHDDSPARLAGIHSLGRMGDSRFIPHLLPHLRSGDPAVRYEALVALHELANRETVRLVDPLLRLLAAGGTPAERMLTLDIFGRIADSSALPQLLALAGRFTPHERRRTEQMIFEIGPRAVPMLVSTVQNLGAPLFARSIAARTLGRLALPQLQAITPALIEAIVKRSYDFISYYVALQNAPDQKPGVAMLGFVYHDLPRLTLEMTLELLSVTGRLPGYDSIIAALRAGDAKERSYALENIEQGCSRWLFARLLPFIDARPAHAVLEVGRQLRIVTEFSAADAINRSLAIPFALESSSALQALYETDRGAFNAAALEKLRTSQAALVRETALTLLARGLPDAPAKLTPVERALHLARTEFFHDWGVRQFEIINPHVRVRHASGNTPLYEKGAPADGVYVVVDGRVTLHNGTRRVVEAGGLLGEEALLGAAVRPESAYAQDARALFVPASAVAACAAVHTQIVHDLLRRKLSIAAA